MGNQRLFLKLEGFHGKRELDTLTWTGGSNKLDKEHKLWSQTDPSSHAGSFTFCCVAICKPCDLLKLQYLVSKMGLEMLLLQLCQDYKPLRRQKLCRERTCRKKGGRV